MKKKYSLIFLIILLFVNCLYSQEKVNDEDSTKRYFPQRISLMENIFWGKQGVFRGFGNVKINRDVRINDLKIRRIMLDAHQIMGCVTLSLLTATVGLGQAIISTENYDLKKLHVPFSIATVSAYFATGTLSIFSPPPLIRRETISLSTVEVHKILAIVHFIGMVVTPFVAWLVSQNNVGDYKTGMLVHQIGGYITLAAFSMSMIVLMF